MRMFTEVGGRAAVHSTAVGKAILSALPEPRVDAILHAAGMPARTANTFTSPPAFKDELARVRERGYATDEQEQEIGVRCVGVVLPGEPVRAAISISGPVGRMSDELIATAVPLLGEVAAALAADLAFAG
jgi:IclR family acetate operon transcriptional repressor